MKNEKHIRIILDFAVSIDKNGIPDPLPDCTPLEWAHEGSERFKRLLAVLLSNEEVLKSILVERCAYFMDSMEDVEWSKLLCCDYDEMNYTTADILLAPIIAQLSQADQDEFKVGEDTAEGYHFVGYCFESSLTSTEVQICDCEVEA